MAAPKKKCSSSLPQQKGKLGSPAGQTIEAECLMPQVDVTEEQAMATEQVAKFLVRFGLAVPAILALESMRPLSVVGSQFMHILTPSITVFLTHSQWNSLAELLEKREGLDYMIQKIEEMEAQNQRSLVRQPDLEKNDEHKT